MVPRVNTYEDQYVCSLAERLFMLMDQQFRMLPGLFDPARDAFDHRQGIEDVMTPGADTAIAHNVEMWVMDNVNKCMWKNFFEKVLWPDFLSPKSPHIIDWARLCILTPYRAMTNYIIDSYKGQEKDIVFSSSTVSASSGPKFVANPNRLCVAFTRMRQGLIIVGDQGTRRMEVTEGGQHLDTRAFNHLWDWFCKNNRVVELDASSA
ncbi:hypothetical protein SLS63_001440 [Diaporthe eres]|uniref:DNA2/NAM7 helicase-like C-terminal domain-containing protein n=1 Tax=Diaporthe eres TaxID=83184 RepID=A0ABR1PMC3_DIAER